MKNFELQKSVLERWMHRRACPSSIYKLPRFSWGVSKDNPWITLSLLLGQLRGRFHLMKLTLGLWSPESAGKDAWSRVPLVQAALGSVCVRCRLHRPWHQISRLRLRFVRVPFTHHHQPVHRRPVYCIYAVFQIPPQSGICTLQGSQLYLSRPGAK